MRGKWTYTTGQDKRRGICTLKEAPGLSISDTARGGGEGGELTKTATPWSHLTAHPGGLEQVLPPS